MKRRVELDIWGKIEIVNIMIEGFGILIICDG